MVPTSLSCNLGRRGYLGLGQLLATPRHDRFQRAVRLLVLEREQDAESQRLQQALLTSNFVGRAGLIILYNFVASCRFQE